MKDIKIAIELNIDFSDTLERRLSKIFQFIINSYDNPECTIVYIDATGNLGKDFSNKSEINGILKLRANEIQKIFDEDGQVIELKLLLNYENIELQFLVVDGMHVNILSNNSKIVDKKILGSFENLGLDLFNFQ